MKEYSKSHLWALPITAAFCTVLGLFVGQGLGKDNGPAKEEESGSAQEAKHLSPATLRNLGVSVAPLKKTNFTQTVPVAAVVVETPRTRQPVFAPIGGRIAEIHVDPGQSLAPGAPVLSIIREPMPRPTLSFTADLLRPAQEKLHEASLELRRSREELRIAKAELERIERYTGKGGSEQAPLLPKERAIELRYQLSRSQNSYDRARFELMKHGLSAEQVQELEKSNTLPPFNEQTWQRALERNGLWPQSAKRLYSALPESLRKLPWSIATIGELAASGLASEELIRWLEEDPKIASHFLELGVRLQQGYSLADLKRLQALDAFDPIVRVNAPRLSQLDAEDKDAAWDVLSVEIKVGARVEEGQPLVQLQDMRQLLLRSEVVGGETRALLDATRSGANFGGHPLIKGSGPKLSGLRVSYIESAPNADGTVAFLELRNTILSRIQRQGSQSRTWALRRGLRYMLDVPLAQLSGVYVLPSGAVTESGPDLIVFLQDGDDFKPVPVNVLFRDDRHVVIPASGDSALFPGDPIVMSGAFELGLATQGSDKVDPHAGHNH
ncbi:MAG: hypothetical protein CSA62_11240 [Planctomycetota bacterium]|nr:MAG: hypothetical protein CSA62_11240 [Planctomycetota bacterium]